MIMFKLSAEHGVGQGFSRMRLLDVKLGAETSVACWKGKSRLNAWKNLFAGQWDSFLYVFQGTQVM